MENYNNDLGVHNILIIQAENNNKELEKRAGKKIKATECYLYEECTLEIFILKKTVGYKIVPFFANYTFKKGMFITQFNGLIKNMIECYPSSLSGGIEYITQEPLKLRFYRGGLEFSVHNIFTSIFYSAKTLLPKISKDEVNNALIKMLNIDNIKIINSNYFEMARNSTQHMNLLRLETKLFFWWNLFSKDRQLPDNIFFVFYLWCFRNISRINKPTLIGNTKRNSPVFTDYFSIIDKSNDPIDLLILRYGPLKLSLQELITRPNKIFTVFRKSECRERLKEMQKFESDIKNIEDNDINMFEEEEETNEIFDFIDKHMNFKEIKK